MFLLYVYHILLTGTYFSAQDGQNVTLSCGTNFVIIIQAVYYGSSTCGPNNMTALFTEMTSDMGTFVIQPSPSSLGSTCPNDGSNTLYGWYNCVAKSCKFLKQYFSFRYCYIVFHLLINSPRRGNDWRHLRYHD